jgi:hypothetical protein
MIAQRSSQQSKESANRRSHDRQLRGFPGSDYQSVWRSGYNR